LKPSAEALNTPDPTPLLSAFLLTLALYFKKSKNFNFTIGLYPFIYN